MADQISLEVHGLPELNEMLSQLPARIAKQVFGRALKVAGQVVKTEMVGRCPVKTKDAGPKSNSLPDGALKADIGSKASLYPQNNAGACRIGPSAETAYVAVWLEYGHAKVSHGKKRNRKTLGNVPAIPFMRQSADATAQTAVDAFAAELGAGIEALNG